MADSPLIPLLGAALLFTLALWLFGQGMATAAPGLTLGERGRMAVKEIGGLGK